MLGTEWHQQKPKVENGAQEQKTIKIIALSRMGIENRKDKVLLVR